MLVSDDAVTKMIATLLGDNQTFGATDYTVELSQQPFDPRTGNDFLPCNFGGSGAIVAPAWIDGVDPSTLNPTLTLTPPAGGFGWTTTGANLPQNISGYRVINNDTNESLGGESFAEGITLTETGETWTLNYPKVEVKPEFLG